MVPEIPARIPVVSHDLGGYFLGVLGTIEKPAEIYEGIVREFLAVREVNKGKCLVVAYRESTTSLIAIL